MLSSAVASVIRPSPIRRRTRSASRLTRRTDGGLRRRSALPLRAHGCCSRRSGSAISSSATIWPRWPISATVSRSCISVEIGPARAERRHGVGDRRIFIVRTTWRPTIGLMWWPAWRCTLQVRCQARTRPSANIVATATADPEGDMKQNLSAVSISLSKEVITSVSGISARIHPPDRSAVAWKNRARLRDGARNPLRRLT